MTDEQFDPETIRSIEATAAEFTRIIESRNAALESARAELSSETRWAKEYYDEAERLRAENARLRGALEAARADYESVRKDFEVVSDRRGIYMDLAERLRAENARLREALNDGVEYAIDLQCEWDYKKHEPRNGNKASYEALVKFIADANAMYAGYPETNETPTA